MAITTGLYSAIPGSPSSGDLYFPTDSFYDVLFYNGGNSPASWDHHANGKLLTTPPSFSWINQGGASVSSTNGGETMVAPTAGGAHQARIRKKAAPSTPYTVTMACLPTNRGTNSSFGPGPLFRESSSGKLRTLYLAFNTVGLLDATKWTSPTAPVSALFTTRSESLVSSPLIFFRLEDDGTNRKYHFSGDGINFVQLYSEGRTVDMTADEIGWFLDPYSQEQKATLIHWKEA